ncbi:hypothetical protein JIG36_40100 [Actinoplanes sp. LDG1-06]|uniref:Uncharacterized protein n=1 Tax=Paractinoplanes ovalisporus TaxID=2810368 RepID=A0ABS2API4_9ACTN|nr:hypothetical protein [Actinoplanes ovalisporus]MBM2621725.1 hypothetical protein [Actinoplanes ovalisporus]
MTGSEVPRTVRTATLLAWLMVPAGALLITAGVLDLVWWAAPDAHRLTALLHDIENEYGIIPPALIRDGRGAVTLIVLGTAGLAYAGMAPLIRKGVRWARSWALGGAIGVFFFGIITIGADASQPRYLRDYFGTLTAATIGDRIPQIEAALYPAFYNWFEDLAQGIGTAVAFGVVTTLIWAVVADPDHFYIRSGRAEDSDEWDEAIARIRATRKPGDQG